jgi:phage tail-like protein
MADDTDPPVSVCWGVTVDDHDLGGFITCEGLGLEVVLELREEGGNNDFVWQLPTRVKYTNIKLTRPIGSSTGAVVEWLAGLAQKVQRTNGCIAAMGADRTVIASYNLTGVIPVRWTGPSLTAESPKIATETLELAHHGFRVRAGR